MERDECMRAETIDRTVYRIIIRMRVCCGYDIQLDFGQSRDMMEV